MAHRPGLPRTGPGPGPLWSTSAADGRGRAHPHRDDAVGVGKRQGPERDRVDDGKDRGCGAGAQRQHEKRAEREAGRRPQSPDGVTQIDEETVERERARRTGRRRFVPARLAQGSEEGFEPAAVELGPGDARGSVRRLPTCDELVPAIVEVLRQLLHDLGFARRRDRELRQARPDVRFPVRLRLTPSAPPWSNGQACSPPVTRRTASTKSSHVCRCCESTL